MACVIVATSSCYTGVDQAALFRNKHPEEARNYDVLAPGSIEYARAVNAAGYVAADTIIAGVEKRKDDPDELLKYLQYLRRIVKAETGTITDLWSFGERLRGNDGVYYFEYSNPPYSDSGILVLRDGDIVYRSPWMTGFSFPVELGKDPVTREAPAHMNVDLLDSRDRP